MEGVKRNSDRKQNVQMRRLIDDPQSREKPLKILEQKVSVFKEPQHAQIHANARNQPATSCVLISGFGHLTAKPKIHRGGPEQERSERRVPGAIKNVTGYDQQIFPGLPRTNAPERVTTTTKKTTNVSELKSMTNLRSNYISESAERVARAMLRQMFRGSGEI